MRGLTAGEAELLEDSLRTEWKDFPDDVAYESELALDKVLAKRGVIRIIPWADPEEGEYRGGSGYSTEITPLGRLALQLYRAGIR